jgi:serine/threonine protein kinase
MFRLDLPPEQTADLAAALEDVVTQQPRHPTIATALAAGVEGKQAYLAQEYVVGDSLDALIRQSGRPPIDSTLVTLSRLAEALDRAAGEGIHHGALHLRDVLLEDGAPRLIDVGVAQALQQAGLRAPIRLPYSAPERVDNQSWGGPADIFALGAIAYELVTGRRIAGPGAPSLWSESVPGADVNALSDVFGRALAIEPGARFASASDLVDALRPILARTQSLPSTVATPADMPAFLAPTDSHDDHPPHEHIEDDVSSDLPLIASAGGAPIHAAAADDRPAFFRSHEPVADHADHVGPFLDVPAPPSPRSVTPAPSGPLWTPPPEETARQRRPFLALIIALVVGVAGGFGWGYWTAWRAAQRETPVAASRTPPPPASPTPPPPAATRPAVPTPPPQRVAEPKAIGETKLPRPTAPTRRSPARAPTATTAARVPKQAPQVPRPKPRTPAVTTGSLLVDSRPVGAQVTVDGNAIGVTPITLDDVSPGDHRVVLQVPGFNLWATTAQVKAGSRTRVAASLEQVQQP